MPRRRAMALAATASGGETMAPRATAAGQLSPGMTKRATVATAGGSGPGGDVTASSKLGEGQARVHHAALVGQLVQVAVLSPRRAAQRRGRTAFANFS